MRTRAAYAAYRSSSTPAAYTVRAASAGRASQRGVPRPGEHPATQRAQNAAYALNTRQARGETEPVPLETGKMTGKMERYSQMRVNPAKNIGLSAFEAAARITAPALFVVAEKEELSNNENVAEAQRQIAARGVPSKFHVIKGITHYGVYKEGFKEAMAVELAWLDAHLRGAK